MRDRGVRLTNSTPCGRFNFRLEPVTQGNCRVIVSIDAKRPGSRNQHLTAPRTAAPSTGLGPLRPSIRRDALPAPACTSLRRCVRIDAASSTLAAARVPHLRGFVVSGFPVDRRANTSCRFSAMGSPVCAPSGVTNPDRAAQPHPSSALRIGGRGRRQDVESEP